VSVSGTRPLRCSGLHNLWCAPRLSPVAASGYASTANRLGQRTGRRRKTLKVRRRHRRLAESSAVEHAPADVVAEPLVVDYEFANGLWELIALPLAL
jgi:hypothetical protein